MGYPQFAWRGPQPPRFGPARVVSLSIAVLLGTMVPVTAAWSYWLCNLATYHCPGMVHGEGGCGDVPARNCTAAQVGFAASVALAFSAIAALLGWRARAGHRTNRRTG